MTEREIAENLEMVKDFHTKMFDVVKRKLDALSSYDKIAVGGSVVSYGKKIPSIEVLAKINKNINEMECNK